jgi:hypothetical protein
MLMVRLGILAFLAVVSDADTDTTGHNRPETSGVLVAFSLHE